MKHSRLIGLVAALALAAPLAACSDTSVMHMQVGQCILRPEGQTATTIETTSCTSEHDAEVFFVTSAEDGEFPGESALNKFAEKQCISNFEAYVGKRFVSSTLDATWMIPTKDSWAQNDRSIMCLAFAMDHSKLKQSVKDSGL